MMPPVTPAAVLVDLLRAGRDAGTAFDAAWPVALVEALAVEPAAGEREAWEVALMDTRQAWEAGYVLRVALARERALVLVGADRDTPIRPTCRTCGTDLPDDRDPRRRYCSDRCRRAFSDGRRPARAA